uniref:LRRNT domain-containing protein n=1 Tax=Electrophorus electricus TaxID=8005 RepID=A0A4W4FGX6_ELEEL
MLLGLLLLIGLLSVGSQGLPGRGVKVCPSPCTCEEEGLLLLVDCSELGLLAVPEDLSPFTSYLDLSMNSISEIEPNAFHNLPFLTELRLDANLITEVPAQVFSGMRSLRHLWLDDNALTEIPASALSDLSSLQAMTLALNRITHISDYAFRNLTNLVVL